MSPKTPHDIFISPLSVDLVGHVTKALWQITIHLIVWTCSKDLFCSGSRMKLSASWMGWSSYLKQHAKIPSQMAQEGLCLFLFFIIEGCSNICQVITSFKNFKIFSMTDTGMLIWFLSCPLSSTHLAKYTERPLDSWPPSQTAWHCHCS